MSSASSPKPAQAVLAAVVAHIAFLQAPDAVELYWIVLLHGIAILTLLMMRTWLRGGAEHADERVRLRCLVAGALGDILVLAGAGYSTSIEPGVIKLGGVLPLGWSCMALVLLDELILLYGTQVVTDQGSPKLARVQRMRWVLLAGGALIALVERLFEQEPRGLSALLTVLFFYTAYSCWHRYRFVIRIPTGPKE